MRAIYEVANRKHRIAYLLGYQCGLTPSDVVKITWNNLNIDFDTEERDFIPIDHTRNKTGEEGTIVLNPDLLHELRNEWLDQGKPDEGYILNFRGNKLQRARRGLKVENSLWLGYKAHFGDEWAKKKLKEKANGTDWKTQSLQKINVPNQQINSTNLIDRYKEWIKFKPQLKFEPNNSHIYLTSGLLDDLLKDQIAMAQKQILVVNPYVEK